MTKEILISIHSKYINLILEGKKNFEFRPFKLGDSSGKIIMWVYETSPVKALKYKMTVKNFITELNSPLKYNLGNNNFKDYISKGKFAYEILSLEELKFPISILEMKKMGVTAPQNFSYINKYPEFQKILKRKGMRLIQQF